MTLYDFLSHMKHNSLCVDIFEEARQFYTGTIGELRTHVVMMKIGPYVIDKIEPLVNSLNIFLDSKRRF